MFYRIMSQGAHTKARLTPPKKSQQSEQADAPRGPQVIAAAARRDEIGQAVVHWLAKQARSNRIGAVRLVLDLVRGCAAGGTCEGSGEVHG